jgi:hypothetical protein
MDIVHTGLYSLKVLVYWSKKYERKKRQSS